MANGASSSSTTSKASAAGAAAAAYGKSTSAVGASAVAVAGAAKAGSDAVELGVVASRLGQLAGFLGLGALAGVFWLAGTGPAGGDSEREFERMVNANQAANGKGDGTTPAGKGAEAAAGAAATGEAATNGTIKRPAGVPEDWVEKPAKKGDGVKWVNPDNPLHDYVRAKPDGTYTQVRDGKAYDAAGNKVATDSAAAHGIKLGDFVFRPGSKK